MLSGHWLTAALRRYLPTDIADVEIFIEDPNLESEAKKWSPSSAKTFDKGDFAYKTP